MDDTTPYIDPIPYVDTPSQPYQPGPVQYGDDTTYYDSPWFDQGPAAPTGSQSGLAQLAQTLGVPVSLLGALLGAVGPAAGLIGNLTSGGQGPTQSGNTNQNRTGSTTGFNNQTGNRAGTTSGFQNTTGTSNEASATTTNQQRTGTTRGYSGTTTTPILDPRASAAADAVAARLGGMTEQTGDMYQEGVGLLRSLAAGGGGVSANAPSAPNTTPRPAAVTGFSAFPSEYNEKLGNLIKQAFGNAAGDVAGAAIKNARARGFAGGADLLQDAAAPIAGPALAEMPGDMATAYLQHVIQAYQAEQNAMAQKASAEAGALNAATNALQPGVQVYGQDVNKYIGELNANNQAISSKAGLVQALMAPQNQWIAQQLGLMGQLPHGQTGTTLSGSDSSETLSGTGTSVRTGNTSGTSVSGGTSQETSNLASNSGGTSADTSSGSSSSSTQTPMGNVIGTGLGNIALGAGQGLAVADQQPNANTLLAALLRG